MTQVAGHSEDRSRLATDRQHPRGRPLGPPSATAAVDAEAETPQGESLVIPAGGRFDGLLAFSGAACIQGLLRGEVRARGSLRIGTSGRVEARLEVDELVVEGRLVGDVVARERVELRSTAVVEGTIHAPRVQLVDGCRFRGRCRSGVAGELPADTEDRVL